MLSERQQEILKELTDRYPVLLQVRGQILEAYERMADCYEKGGSC